MKKAFLLACAMLAAVLSFAQETKKVAILETVDREGKVSYANKLILRSNLAKAITNTPGYEAYDRTDMDAILGEQNFQRTGMVSNEQIKRLGEMTGAKYVLVAEAVVVDASNMYITAKLLDVETARTEMTDNQMMGSTAKEIQRGCQLLAEKLIKPILTAANAGHQTTNSRNKQTVEGAAPIYEGGYITRVSSNEYRLNGTKMDKKAYEEFLINNCPEAWRKYKSGKNAIAAGWSLFGIGAAAVGVGGVLMAVGYNNYNYTMGDSGIGLMISGGLLGGVGLITFSAGYGARNNAYKRYNKKCASAPMSLNLVGSQNGLGLALRF
ncbi:MAG: hypothetical protein IJP45_01170 [Paludibacteraceae bacterium]|nr:hypothetical protein [Paludibacteraceae bacterium]MBQ6763777.1 hypothetical protein [Paludibacteraceae bacterium]MBQ9339749.1 hypothetical protein [Paludibacteraceae bacterium]